MTEWMNSFYRILRLQVLKWGDTHAYTGRSIILLALQRMVRFAFYFRTPRPSRHSMQEMAKYRGNGAGKIALVLGNGPSLQKLIPSQVRENFDDIFIVNGFHNLQIAEHINPSFYCLSDPFDNSELNDEKSPEGVLLSRYFKENLNCIRLLPHTWEFESHSIPNQTLYFDDREQTIFSRNISPLKPRAYTSVTLYKALAVACFMGYKEIFILGFDNTEFLGYCGRPDNLTDFKETIYAPLKEGRIYSRGNELFPFNFGMAGRMQSYAHLFGDLDFFKDYPIQNLDPSSLTDAFPKILHHPAVNS